MLLLRWSNNNVIHGSQRRYFFHKTKVVRLEKKTEVCSCWVYLTQSEARSSKRRPVRPRLLKQHFPKLTAIWKKGCDACKKKSVRCNRKATFHYKCRLQEVFRAGLKEIKYDYADSKQHFIYSRLIMLQQQKTDMKPLCKKQATPSSGVPRVYRAWGQTQFKRSQPVRGSIKWKKQCNLMLYLQLSNSKDKVFLPLLLKMYRLYCQTADKI